MSRKGEKVSFRITEKKFSALSEIAKQEDVSLSQLCQDYANTLKETGCRVKIVPEDTEHDEDSYNGEEYPPQTTVTSQFVREHERLELQTDHLRESLNEIKAHKRHLESQLTEDDIVSLESIDRKNGNIE